MTRLSAVQRAESLMYLRSARERLEQAKIDEWPPDRKPWGPRLRAYLIGLELDGLIKSVEAG